MYKEKLEKSFEAGKAYNVNNSNSDWFKFKEGANTFRILSEPVIFFEDYKRGICYTDCAYQGSAKFLTWILDRADNKIKLGKFPYTKGIEIVSMENDVDYGFTGFPMPYDITINADDKVGTKDVTYSAPLPRPIKPLSQDILVELGKRKPCEEIIEKLKEKNKQKHVADGTFQKEQDRKAALAKELGDARTKPTQKIEIAEGIDYPQENIHPDDIPF